MWGSTRSVPRVERPTQQVRDAAARDLTQRANADDGFSLIEQIIAMVVIVIVLLGLLGTLGAAAKGVVTGRQRTIAVSLAKQAIENLQGAKYSDVASGTGVAC